MATATKQSRRRSCTSASRLKDLQATITLCFVLIMEGPDDTVDMRELSNRSRLSLATLYRLRNGEASLAMRFGTIQAFALACGVSIETRETGIHMYLAE